MAQWNLQHQKQTISEDQSLSSKRVLLPASPTWGLLEVIWWITVGSRLLDLKGYGPNPVWFSVSLCKAHFWWKVKNWALNLPHRLDFWNQNRSVFCICAPILSIKQELAKGHFMDVLMLFILVFQLMIIKNSEYEKSAFSSCYPREEVETFWIFLTR